MDNMDNMDSMAETVQGRIGAAKTAPVAGERRSTRPRRVSVLGATGSIGLNTLDLIMRRRDAYEVIALTANRKARELAELALKVRPRFVALCDEARYPVLKDALCGSGIESACGEEAVLEAARRPCDWVMSAIVGAAGLPPTLAAAQSGVVLALANKESLVCAGELLLAEAARCKSRVIPVDSEHSAIFQVLDRRHRSSLERIVLTASGGPFRTTPLSRLSQVTPRQALAHPNWDMGAKITVDSATMMNKGLELIEACRLFDVAVEKVEVVIHPQSLLHSAVRYRDGSMLAQLGHPDMRTPIAYALAWPQRMKAPVSPLDLARAPAMTFFAPDEERFPTLNLARQACREGGAAPVILNAANEVAVDAFLNHRLGFCGIAALIERALERMTRPRIASVADVLALDRKARRKALELLGNVATVAAPYTGERVEACPQPLTP